MVPIYAGILALFGTGTAVTWTVDIVAGILSYILYIILSVAGWFLAAAGTLLNIGMFLTTHIKLFVEQTPVIYTVWGIIRDISSMLLIFIILYAAIRMIISWNPPNFGDLIKNIIIVGILINFSFFFASVLIDFSNIVSLEFYNAIAPNNTASMEKKITNISQISEVVPELLNSGGLANIIMGSLQMNTWLGKNGDISQIANGSGLGTKLAIINAAGIVVATITALSLFAVAAACVIRLALLIFLLAFSPIWIASRALPQLKEFSDKWWGAFKAQLIFLPVYLALMYVALRVVTDSKLTDMIGADSTNPLGNIMNLIVGYAIIIVMLNIPLATAVSVAGAGSKSLKWVQGLNDKMRGAVQGWAKRGLSYTGSAAYRNTVGRGASRLAQNASFQKFAGSSMFGAAAIKATRSIAKTHDEKLTAKIKSREDFAKSLDKDGAKAYADRLSKSVPSQVGLSMAHVLGRSDRVAAAKILNTRMKEVKEEQDKLTSELRKHQKAEAARGWAGLSQYEKDRLDALQGQNNGGNNTIDPKTGLLINEITSAQKAFNDMKQQVDDYKTNIGVSTKEAEKRNY